MGSIAMLDSNIILLMVLGGIVLFIAVFGLLSVFISFLNYEHKPVRDRLLMLKEKGTFEGSVRANVGAFDDLQEALMTFSGPISQNLYGQNEKYLKQLKLQLTEAGQPDNETAIAQFLARRVALGIVLAALFGVPTLVITLGDPAYTLFGFIGGFVVGTMTPQFQLKQKAKKRKAEIRFTLSDTLDLMVVCVEAGLGMDATIQKVAEETERMAPELSQEFKRLNKELNAGISRTEAFQNLGQRAGVDELRSLCAMIIQADKMGTSVSDTLRVYADDLRVKRRQKAEELAAKASIKMTFPLVFFIFPPLFIVLMGPMVIQIAYQFVSGLPK
jgi:tight adherence protein C